MSTCGFHWRCAFGYENGTSLYCVRKGGHKGPHRFGNGDDYARVQRKRGN